MTEWTHKKLVKRMAQWLKNRHINIVISELSTVNRETPDAIGWNHSGTSTLIECKTSRADFLADRDKLFRQFPEGGMGDVRYFATPRGLLSVDELPSGWGLLELGERNVHVAKEAPMNQGNKRAECIMLLSALRRLQISTAVYVVAEEELLDGTDGGGT